MTETVWAGGLDITRGDLLTITRSGVPTRLRVTLVEREPGEQAWTITTELAGDE